MLGTGLVAELLVRGGSPVARIACAPPLIPAPGQYLQAHEVGSALPLATSLFRAGVAADGFLTAPPIPAAWRPGIHLALRGPLGRGFTCPDAARRVALVSLDADIARLLGLAEVIRPHGASMTLIGRNAPDDLPLDLEVQPLGALIDVLKWADYAAFDVGRESLPQLGALISAALVSPSFPHAQILVRTPMPCGALAECGVCAVQLRTGFALACDDGPVLDLRLVSLEG